jgi:hypothetical protein
LFTTNQLLQVHPAGDLENGPPKPAAEFTIKGGEKVFLEIDGINQSSPPPPPLILFPAKI